MNKEIEKSNLIGWPFNSVKEALNLFNINWRVAKWHGQHRVLTRDYRQDRYNLYVNEQDIVEDITFG